MRMRFLFSWMLLLTFCKMHAQEGLPVLVSTTTGNIYEININNCTSRFICATHKQLFDIAFTPDGRLWGNTIDSLFRIDTTNGSLMPIGACLGSSALVGLNDSLLIIEHVKNLYSIKNTDASIKLIGNFGCNGTDGDFTWYHNNLYVTCHGNYIRIKFDSAYTSIADVSIINDSMDLISIEFPGLATVYSNNFENKLLAFASYGSGIDLYTLNTDDTFYQIHCFGIVDTGSVYGATSMVFPIIPPIQPNSIAPINNRTSQFLLYPNPATDKIFIGLNDNRKNEDITLTIYDYLGRLVLQRQIQSKKEEINLKDYDAGLYHVQLIDHGIQGNQRGNKTFLKIKK